MKSKTFIFIALMAWVNCAQAQTTVTAETVRPIIEAANKPFTEFATAIRSTQLPGLPLPNSTSADRHLIDVSQLLWRQLSSVDAATTAANKASVLSSLEAMCGVRSWLLDNHSYANLLFAARIEETVCLSSLSALAESHISVDEARSLMRHLDNPIQLSEVVAMLEAAAPSSKTVAQIKSEGVGASSMLDVSERLAKESPELIDTRVTKLIEREQLASIVCYLAYTTAASRFSNELVELAAKGGQLTRPRVELIEQIKKLSPEAVGKIDHSTGLKVDAAMLAGLMDSAKNWKAKQQAKP